MCRPSGSVHPSRWPGTLSIKDCVMSDFIISPENVDNHVQYDDATGLVRVRFNPRWKWRLVTRINRGYLRVQLSKGIYYAHRLAWLSFYGAWPVGQIDHINGNKIDNRMANLRDVPASINRQNQHNPMRGNSIGILGVRRNGMKFETSICVEGKGVWLGTFESAEEAQSEYFKAKRIYHPGFTG